jgi:hypothetical protein|tara:strand:+ start:414 stop:716 length:303 start_codon:yes stop_codon:yes gene_type:complete
MTTDIKRTSLLAAAPLAVIVFGAIYSYAEQSTTNKTVADKVDRIDAEHTQSIEEIKEKDTRQWNVIRRIEKAQAVYEEKVKEIKTGQERIVEKLDSLLRR